MAVKKVNKYLKSEESGFFGLGRVVDFSDTVTRIAILAAIISAVIGTVWKTIHGEGSEAAAYFGMGTALQFFLTYLIAQELDPDRKLGGLIGGGISLILALTMGIGNVLALLWLLFILRLISRTSGARHQIGDNCILIIVGYFLGKEGLWLFPVLTGVAYVVESQLKDGYFRSLYIGGLAFASVALAEVDRSVPIVLDVTYVYVMLVTFFLFLPAITVASITKFKGEKDGKPINPRRLQTAQGLYLIINFTVAWFHGNVAAQSMMASWAAGIGVGVYLLVIALQKIMFKGKEEQ